MSAHLKRTEIFIIKYLIQFIYKDRLWCEKTKKINENKLSQKGTIFITSKCTYDFWRENELPHQQKCRPHFLKNQRTKMKF